MRMMVCGVILGGKLSELKSTSDQITSDDVVHWFEAMEEQHVDT